MNCGAEMTSYLVKLSQRDSTIGRTLNARHPSSAGAASIQNQKALLCARIKRAMLPPFGPQRGDEVVGGLRRAATGVVDVAPIRKRAIDFRLDDVQRDLDEVRAVRTV